MKLYTGYAALADAVERLTNENALMRGTLLGIRRRIIQFDGQCRRSEYTDTDEVWEIFRTFRNAIDGVTRPSRSRSIRTADRQPKRVLSDPGAKSGRLSTPKPTKGTK